MTRTKKLSAGVEPRTACKSVVALLTLARDRRCEAELAVALTAIRLGDRAQAIRLSAAFRVHIMAEIGNAVLVGIVRELVARSSLVLTLYMRGHAPVCHDDQHAAILKILGEIGCRRAASPMCEHLTEIAAGFDFNDRPKRWVGLRDILLATEAKPTASRRRQTAL